MKTRCIGPFGESIEKHLELRSVESHIKLTICCGLS
jgi:hypothetical protein